MSSKVLFTSVEYDKYDYSVSLPSKFSRLLDKMDMGSHLEGKKTVIKMHLGRSIGYSTVHPLFVKMLVDRVKEYGGKPYISDQSVEGARARGYTEEYLGCPIVFACGVTDKYYKETFVEYKSLKNVDIAGNIMDADAMIDLSHVKGHGACGYGGACKNIAMGCVTTRTRGQIHGLEGGIDWNEELCTHCELCINSCNHSANGFNDEGKYKMNFHHCTLCQHCVKVCPTGALTMNATNYKDFQTGMAIATKRVLESFDENSVFYINFLVNITAICDCWGFTLPAMVPDIGITASNDMVAIDKACLDLIKPEDVIMSGIPQGMELRESGHLFERLHGKDPFIQLRELEKLGVGTQEYTLETIV